MLNAIATRTERCVRCSQEIKKGARYRLAFGKIVCYHCIEKAIERGKAARDALTQLMFGGDPMTKTERAKAIADKVEKPAKAPRAKTEPTATEEVEVGLESVSDIARGLNMDPKVARAKLRRSGKMSADGRWPKMKPGSKAHSAIIAILKGDKE